MSRIGKMPIVIPGGVKILMEKNTIRIEGPKGKMEQNIRPEIKVTVGGNTILLERDDESKRVKAMHGMYRNLIGNMITGVSKGFTKMLIINGVGYRAEVKGKILVLNLGYSNPVEYPIPEGISINVDANTKIIVNSIDKARLGQVCAEIRKLRPPEPYKGKGIKYETEYIKRKIGKAGVK